MPEIFHPYASFGHQSRMPMRFEADVFECEVEGEIPRDSHVLYAHLGGQPAINAYHSLWPAP